MALDLLLALSNSNRLEDIERRETSSTVLGDFEGSVGGSWVRLDESGAGIVKYNDKEYVTKRLGFTSIPAGTAVELSYGNGIYYSKW